MLTKQARQFEQWADENDRLKAIKANQLTKKAAKRQAELKQEGAVFLSFSGTLIVMASCFGFVTTNNPDCIMGLLFGFGIAMIGFTGLKK